MKLEIVDINDGDRIPERFAFGVPDAKDHVRLGENLNPCLRWGEVPAGCRSLVLLCV